MKKKLLSLFLLSSIVISAQTGHEIDGSFKSSSGGTEVVREYRLYVPLSYNASSAPVTLVMNFHGLSGSSTQQEGYGDFRKIADTANFIIVHPMGLPVSNLFGANAFNVFYAPDLAQPDIDFASHLIDTIKAHYNINLGRVFVTGMSNGGFMSYELACRLSNRIAGIASVCGSMEPQHKAVCNPKHPTPVMEIHGTNDGTVKYDGTPGNTFLTFTHTDSLVKYWVKKNHCNLAPTVAIGDTLPNISTTDNCKAVHFVWTGGDEGSTVELYRIIGGDHSWPGATTNLNTTNMDFSASKEIWRFFSQQKTLTGIEEEEKSNTDFSVYPNPTNGSFTLAIANLNSKKLTVSVIDMLGKEVFAFADNNSAPVINKQINLENVPAGIYFIKVSTDSDYKTKKMIIQ